MRYIITTALYVLVFCGAIPEQFKVVRFWTTGTLESQVQIPLGARICVCLLISFCFGLVMSQSQFKGVLPNVQNIPELILNFSAKVLCAFP